jgi:predicted O-linked N-acetylglucosamine transferase (SPINDLY family)
MNDERLAKLVRDDGIDILVDLTLHLSGNRLLTFARKPAPVQVTFAGYPAGTGLEAIDYRLSDRYLDPPGTGDENYSERTVRLPHTFWCYEPDGDGPDVGPLPSAAAGRITFGCLSNFCKVNAPVLRLWSRVLATVPGSRMLLLCPRGEHRAATVEAFAAHGIDPGRLELVEPGPRRQYLEHYHRIDIALDTFPYNGHTTGLDALWMGVPVVTLVRESSLGRAGWSQLSNLHLTELASNDEDEYVAIASKLAGDIPRLSELRSTLRQRMRASPLMDAPNFARGIENAYRQMWRTWCGAG